ncbi:Pol polyprotein [Plakobranchus ocellatus]|uniref:Pol polyprotein n=1 Tax=Plakobranchus ocellatus TaxID=259542 RepID=A0AAV4BF06_9GAST|nr:Pol polyprotein [Plakobranchus ocellatus]
MVSLKTVASAYIDARPHKPFRKKHSVSFSAKSEPYRPLIRVVDKGNNRSNWPRPQRSVSRSNYSSQGHRSPSFQVCSGAVKRGTSRSPSRDRSASNFKSKNVGKGQHFGLVRAVVLVWPPVIMTSHVISVVARDMCAVSAQAVQRTLIPLIRHLNCLLIAVPPRWVVILKVKPSTGRDRPAPFQPVPIVGEPFERVIIDLVGPLPLSCDRYEYLLTLVNVSTRWAEAVPLRRITAKDVAEALFSIFVRLGFPKEIQSDRGQQFMSNLLAEFNSLCSIKHFDSVRDSFDESRLRHEPKSKLIHFVPGDEVLVLLPTSDNKLVLSYKGPYKVVEKRTSVVYLVDLGDRKCAFHVNLLRKYKCSTYAPSPPSDNLVGVDNACSSQAFADATSFCDPSLFVFSSLSTVEPSLSVNTVIDENLDPNHDSNLTFCETICSAEPTAYVSAISEEDGGEIGSLVTTPPLASESGTVIIDPNLSASQVQDVKELLIEFQDILTSVPGCTNTLCHEIRLTTDAVIRVKPYPLLFAAREFVTQEVNDLLSLGVIEPSDSPYCFPIVVVKKRDGSMTLCIDFRKLNAVTVFDAENIPRQEDLFNQLSHSTIFSSCDLCKAYWQVPLHPDSRKYTAFQTPLGLMQWVRMPFELVTAPATFCRLMRLFIGQTPDLLSYFDDTLVLTT